MKRTALVIVAVILYSCGNERSDSSAQLKDTLMNSQDTIAEKDRTNVKQDSVKQETAIRIIKDTITIPFIKDSVIVPAYMQGMGKHVTFIVPAKNAKNLRAEIIVADTANIRINQVFTPSGKADGPFQKTIDIPVKETGNYKIVVGENQMAANEWKGDFKIKVSLY